ncbi:UNVERIFIED_CONTAM: hypothetical protein RF653_01125 [Kocuria sp. CPCC 205316]|uniref:hypothetical protein n=1 Tax=Kocuria TaxID=57493 RepID=UPI0036D7FA03
MNASRRRRVQQVAVRALALIIVFAVAYAAAVASGIATSLPLDPAYSPLLVGVGAVAALTCAWAFEDGRRLDSVPNPVQLWAAVSLVSALVVTALVSALWVFLAAAMGGSVVAGELPWIIAAALVAAVLAAVVGTAVAVAVVRAARMRTSRRR